MEYRVKIEEKNNGEKRYIPQTIYEKRLFGLFSSWGSIIKSHEYGLPIFEVSTSLSISYDSEKKAEQIINEFKEYTDDLEGKKMKRISYKSIS
jgi:hypothetical protein